MHKAIATGLPLHSGRHLGIKQPGSADALIRFELEQLEEKYENGLIDKSELIDAIGKIENRVREALKSNKVRLQKNDPHWQPGE